MSSQSPLHSLPKRLLLPLAKKFLTPDVRARIKEATQNLNSAGFDPWGLDPEAVELVTGFSLWLYRDYFRVSVVGLENLPDKRMLLISNHGGQIPIDGFCIGMALLTEGNPPRISRGMVERWAPSVPFVSTLFSRLGQLIGDHHNCLALLEREQAVLAFPEGAKGSGKTIQERYQLQKFGTGFMRLALESKAPIVPVAVIGSEEVYPSVFNFKWLAKKMGAPYFPITPFFPLLGPVGALPLPCKITIRFGEPISFEGDADCSDEELQSKIDVVKAKIRHELKVGLSKRKDEIFTKAGI